jgi:hypothetical protein
MESVGQVKTPAPRAANEGCALGGFSAHVVLESWLSGWAFLQSPVTLSGEIRPLGAASNLAFSASGEARFPSILPAAITIGSTSC